MVLKWAGGVKEKVRERRTTTPGLAEVTGTTTKRQGTIKRRRFRGGTARGRYSTAGISYDSSALKGTVVGDERKRYLRGRGNHY